MPPPIITLLGIVGIVLTDRMFPGAGSDTLGGMTATIIFAVLGVGLLLWSGYAFKVHETTVNPLVPERATHLVTTGPYRFSRNPMYLAMVLILWAAFVSVGNWLGLVVVIIVLLYFDMVQIAAEESALKSKFKDEFEAYAGKVRKWI